MAINHCLIAHPNADLKDIKSVYSHPQALGQCRSFLNRHSWKKIPAFDTAGSVKMIKELGKIEEAAIASKRAAAVYEMKVLAEGIQNRHDNFTRFLQSKGQHLCFLMVIRPPSCSRPGTYRGHCMMRSDLSQEGDQHDQSGIPTKKGEDLGNMVFSWT